MSPLIYAALAVTGIIAGWLAKGARDHWRKAGRDLDRLSDLSDDTVDPDWPDTRNTMGDDDDEH